MRISIWIAVLCAVAGLLLISCDTPGGISQPEHEQLDTEVLFLANLYVDAAGSCQPGYANGNIGTTEVTLKWNAYTGDDFLAYSIYRSDESNAMMESVVDQGVTQITLDDLNQDTWYSFKLITSTRSTMVYSDSIRIRTASYQAASDIEINIVDDETFSLYWANNAQTATKYKVYWTELGEINLELLGATEDTTMVVSTLEMYHNYGFLVETDFADADSLQSSLTVIHVTYATASPTLEQAAQSEFDGATVLRWSNSGSTAEQGYYVLRASEQMYNEGEWEMLAMLPPQSSYYRDADVLQSDSLYFYKVTAFTEEDEYESNVMTVTWFEPNMPSNLMYIPPAMFYWDAPCMRNTEWYLFYVNGLLYDTVNPVMEEIDFTPQPGDTFYVTSVYYDDNDVLRESAPSNTITIPETGAR